MSLLFVCCGVRLSGVGFSGVDRSGVILSGVKLLGFKLVIINKNNKCTLANEAKSKSAESSRCTLNNKHYQAIHSNQNKTTVQEGKLFRLTAQVTGAILGSEMYSATGFGAACSLGRHRSSVRAGHILLVQAECTQSHAAERQMSLERQMSPGLAGHIRWTGKCHRRCSRITANKNKMQKTYRDDKIKQNM